MLDFYRRINHFSAPLTFLLAPFLFVSISYWNGFSYGYDLIVIAGVCLAAALVFFFIKRKELKFQSFKSESGLTTKELSTALSKISKERKWKLIEGIDDETRQEFFEIKTPTAFTSWGCLITVLPTKDGFKLRCINAVDYPLNQAFMTFGHRTWVRNTLLEDLSDSFSFTQVKSD